MKGSHCIFLGAATCKPVNQVAKKIGGSYAEAQAPLLTFLDPYLLFT